MKQPKYKGYSKETESWHYGFGWCLDGLTEECKLREGIEDYAVLYTESSPIKCELDSMGQYTKQNDHQGNELYERDVVQHIHAKWTGVIHFRNGSYRIKTAHGSWELLAARAEKVIWVGNTYLKSISAGG